PGCKKIKEQARRRVFEPAGSPRGLEDSSAGLEEEAGMNRIGTWGTLVAVIALGRPAMAQDWPVPRGPGREPVPYRYDAKVWKQVPRPFLEDHAACILYSGATHLIEPDGTVESINHEITRL